MPEWGSSPRFPTFQAGSFNHYYMPAPVEQRRRQYANIKPALAHRLLLPVLWLAANTMTQCWLNVGSTSVCDVEPTLNRH